MGLVWLSVRSFENDDQNITEASTSIKLNAAFVTSSEPQRSCVTESVSTERTAVLESDWRKKRVDSTQSGESEGVRSTWLKDSGNHSNGRMKVFTPELVNQVYNSNSFPLSGFLLKYFLFWQGAFLFPFLLTFEPRSTTLMCRQMEYSLSSSSPDCTVDPPLES